MQENYFRSLSKKFYKIPTSQAFWLPVINKHCLQSMKLVLGIKEKSMKGKYYENPPTCCFITDFLLQLVLHVSVQIRIYYFSV